MPGTYSCSLLKISLLTDARSELQSSIYVGLDERTPDKGAMASLQAELKDMRALLKRLRESTRGEL